MEDSTSCVTGSKGVRRKKQLSFRAGVGSGLHFTPVAGSWISLASWVSYHW